MNSVSRSTLSEEDEVLFSLSFSARSSAFCTALLLFLPYSVIRFFTSMNSFTISSSGLGVTRLTRTITPIVKSIEGITELIPRISQRVIPPSTPLYKYAYLKNGTLISPARSPAAVKTANALFIMFPAPFFIC